MRLIKKLSDDEIRSAFYDRFVTKTGDLIVNTEQAYEHLSWLITNREREKFGIIYLTSLNAIINSEILFTGTLAGATIYPREIIIKILNNNAAAIIIGHNHITGSIRPSQDDKDVTRVIQQACDTINVQLLDHLIIANGRWYSFKKNSLLIPPAINREQVNSS